MPTSSFEKQFAITPKNGKQFKRVYSSVVSPTLPADFKSKFVDLKKDEKVRKELLKALG